MHTVKITKDEQKAIASLKRLAKKWPNGLSLFSWSGSLVVTKHVDGKSAYIDNIINIDNDGGDPCMGDGPEDDFWDESDLDIYYE